MINITGKQEILSDLEKRLYDNILEQSNFDLLKKLVENADTLDEAIKIAELGTTYKRTGFHFDKRLERQSNTISYFKKNNELSFTEPEKLDKGKDFFSNNRKPITHKLIIGDNYPALLNLLVEYKGKIDVIYIDPPYGKDSMGEFAETNYDNAITRDNLLSMLYPRLWVSKQLLTDSGVIFCSIDDKNQAYVKCLFDEVFEENNFVGQIVWSKKRKGSFLTKGIISTTEYILTYTRGKAFNGLFGGKADESESQPIIKRTNRLSTLNIPANTITTKLQDGEYQKGVYGDNVNPVELLDDIIVKSGIIVNDFSMKAPFIWSQKMFDEQKEKGAKFVINTLNFQIRVYKISDDDDFKGVNSYINGVAMKATNEDAYEELEDIFGVKKIFDFSKPVNLMKHLIGATTYFEPNAFVLDFFAGSGTTGQAVLELNKEDGENGNRQFILVTSNEITPTTPNGVVKDVTSKRLKRVMTGKCYDGTNDFEWIKKNTPLGDNLEVIEIAEVSNFEAVAGKTAFDVIDETLYGNEKFATVKDKVEWVCNNFEVTQKRLEE